jgi:hypothetical protein
MVLRRHADREFIRDRFAILRNAIESDVSLNVTGLNISVENFFRDLLNLVLDGDYKNLNIDLGNTAAIDLADVGLKHCIQVTSTSDKSKIDKTLKKFVAHGLHQKYNRLTVFIATKKKAYKSSSFTDPTGAFSIIEKEDVWDWDNIMKMIDNLEPSKLAAVRDFVEKGIRVEQSKVPQKEVATLFALMEALSDETHEQAGKGNSADPDPDNKIEKRFSAHADFLKREYATYYVEYGAVLEDAYNGIDLGSARMRRLGLHLGTKSDELLAASGDDPKLALNNLVKHYLKVLQEHARASDEGAVRFFLLDQIIRCHVFPNPVLESV